MRPKFALLDTPLIERILAEAFQLINDLGVRVAPYVEDLLRAAGITVKDGVAHIPEPLARTALQSVPREFHLYDRNGRPAVHYGGSDVHFDPGSIVVEQEVYRSADGTLVPMFLIHRGDVQPTGAVGTIQ